MKSPGGKLRFGLIGAGGIGGYHRKAIEGLQCAGSAELVAVADPADLPGLAERTIAQGARLYRCYEDMLETEKELDAVAIATPIPFHFEMTRACLERGLYVQLEKPPVPLLSQFEELLAMRGADKVQVGFQMIESDNIQKLKGLIVSGKLGKITSVRAGACWPRLEQYYSRAKWAGCMAMGDLAVFDGPATNALAHLVHHLMYLGAADADGFALPDTVQGELYRARPSASYDTACLRGHFPSGAEFSLAVTHATRKEMPFRVEVKGSQGWARISQNGARLETSGGAGTDREQDTQELVEKTYATFADVYFGRSKRFRTRLADARPYVATTNALLRSSGGVAGIAPVRIYGQSGNSGYEVPGLDNAVARSIQTGETFSEQGCAWATIRPTPVTLNGFAGIGLADLLACEPSPRLEAEAVA